MAKAFILSNAEPANLIISSYHVTCNIVRDKSTATSFLMKMETVCTHIGLVDEFDERRSFNLHRLSIAIEKLQHEVKKVAFPQIGWWLLGKLNSGDLATEKEKVKALRNRDTPGKKEKEVVTAGSFDH